MNNRDLVDGVPESEKARCCGPWLEVGRTEYYANRADAEVIVLPLAL